MGILRDFHTCRPVVIPRGPIIMVLQTTRKLPFGLTLLRMALVSECDNLTIPYLYRARRAFFPKSIGALSSTQTLSCGANDL